MTYLYEGQLTGAVANIRNAPPGAISAAVQQMAGATWNSFVQTSQQDGGPGRNIGGALPLLTGAVRVEPGATGGPTAGKNFSKTTKQGALQDNANTNGGTPVCENCSQPVVPGQKGTKGVTPPGNQAEIDHIQPKSQNGYATLQNAQVLCRDCNAAKSNTVPTPNTSASAVAAAAPIPVNAPPAPAVKQNP